MFRSVLEWMFGGQPSIDDWDRAKLRFYADMELRHGETMEHDRQSDRYLIRTADRVRAVVRFGADGMPEVVSAY